MTDEATAAYGPGDGPADPSFDRYARMVRRALHVPVALVSIVEESRQIFPGATGLPEPLRTTRETSLAQSVCAQVVKEAKPLVVRDSREDERLRDVEPIEQLEILAYVGWPLIDPDGTPVGALCAIDREPRDWSDEEVEALADLAAACSSEIAHRELERFAYGRAAVAREAERQSRVLLALSEALSKTRTLVDISRAVERVTTRELGCLQAGMWLREVVDPLQVAPATPPRPETPPEPMVFVDNAVTDWAQATRHSVLPVAEDNPLGEALLREDVIAFRDRAQQNRRYPHLAGPEQVGEGRVFVPLVAAGQAYGTLALLWPEVRDLTHDDRATVASLTGYTAQAVQRALLLKERVDVSLTLQNAMLTRLPHTDDVELAARYRPAARRDQVGGDWYDAAVLPSGEISLTIGDVVGHDIRAAAVMGQLRSMLRALAWAEDDTPAHNVERLDRATWELEVEAMATLVFARVDRDDGSELRTLRWTNAGHPPPLLVAPDGEITFLGRGTLADCMLGVVPERERSDHVAQVPRGSTVLFYTDGLIERRREDMLRGYDRVADCARRHHGLSVDDFLDAVLTDLLPDEPDDDVAVLAARLR